MAATVTAPSEAVREAVGRREHPHCFACRPKEEGGLGLTFRVGADGGVAAEWNCPPAGCGYDGILHGGLVATLLDSAMVHVLFARNIIARTAELRVRYHHVVRTGEPATVVARPGPQTGPLCQLEAAVWQGGLRCATARAKFMVVAG